MWAAYVRFVLKPLYVCSASVRAAPLLNILTLGKIAVCNLGVFGT